VLKPERQAKKEPEMDPGPRELADEPNEQEDIMLLEDKNAVIYGGGGSIGGAVARAFAREGAKVFLASRP
jgi:FlaA1/EpsC-like NDP-sugar epimerase